MPTPLRWPPLTDTPHQPCAARCERVHVDTVLVCTHARSPLSCARAPPSPPSHPPPAHTTRAHCCCAHIASRSRTRDGGVFLSYEHGKCACRVDTDGLWVPVSAHTCLPRSLSGKWDEARLQQRGWTNDPRNRGLRHYAAEATAVLHYHLWSAEALWHRCVPPSADALAYSVALLPPRPSYLALHTAPRLPSLPLSMRRLGPRTPMPSFLLLLPLPPPLCPPPPPTSVRRHRALGDASLAEGALSQMTGFEREARDAYPSHLHEPDGARAAMAELFRTVCFVEPQEVARQISCGVLVRLSHVTRFLRTLTPAAEHSRREGLEPWPQQHTAQRQQVAVCATAQQAQQEPQQQAQQQPQQPPQQ